MAGRGLHPGWSDPLTDVRARLVADVLTDGRLGPAIAGLLGESSDDLGA